MKKSFLPEFITKFLNKSSASSIPKFEQIDSNSYPDNLYLQCPKCKKLLYRKKIDKNYGICLNCNFHFSIDVNKWLEILADHKTFIPLFTDLKTVDILKFPGYEKRIAQLTETNIHEAITTGRVEIKKIPTLIGIMDNSYLMGSMGAVAGEKITRLFELGMAEKLPVILIIRSGGARMQEGVVSLMQMVKTSAAIKRFSDAGNFYIPILTNPTTGGVSASFAMLGDITIAEPGALIGFAGPRVIEQTIKQKLPKGFQSAEFLKEKGYLDSIVSRNNLKEFLGKVLKVHRYA